MNNLYNILGVILLASTVLTAGCLDDNGTDENSNLPPDSTGDSIVLGGLNEFINSTNEFSFNMYQELTEGNENVFFSPYSITTALGMAYEGARGETAAEMEQVLEIPKDRQTRLDMMKEYQSIFNKKGPSYNLSTANSYWLREGGSLKQEYKDAIENYYLAHGEELDFAGDPAGSVDTINEWVEGETNEKIKDLLSVQDIDYMTYLVLTNAIYFKSDWKYQFDESATENMDFHLSDGTDITTDMMRMCDEDIDLKYSSNSEVQLLQLPYENNEISMYVMLPKENDIGTVSSKLDISYLNTLKSDLTAKYIDLYLPKFKLEEKYRLKKNLKNMGMSTAFTSNADFSGINNAGLFITKVIHQSFIEVNEEGTEAAAATAVIMGNFSAGSAPDPIQFKADRPFMFIIEHKESGQILFMGKVEDPTGELG